MCDTMAATAAATTTGGTVFAKNSDRERNEAQYLDFRPRRRFGAGARLRATYIAIPQAEATHAVLLSRPFWIWGAEMGVNEHGVAIGNEAVHPRLAPQRRPALIGMDLLRLGLERGATAAAAVEVITTLLEQFGQGGSCGHLSARFYDNSFIVADAREAYVLETVGRHWAVARIAGARPISNTYTITTDIHASSAGLRAFAREQGWWRGGKFDFARAVTNPDNPGLQGAIDRCGRSTRRLAALGQRIDAKALMGVLRDHGADATAPGWHPQDIAGPTVCMHAGDGTRRGQSVGSLVSDLRPGGAVHWVTGTSAPCTGIFKPVFMDVGLPDTGPTPGDRFDADTLWWRHETLHRALLHATPDAWPGFAAERDALEAGFATRAEAALGADTATRRQVSAACWAEAAAAEARWAQALSARNEPAGALRGPYLRAWAKYDRLACMAA